jgi:hypothetical protein
MKNKFLTIVVGAALAIVFGVGEKFTLSGILPGIDIQSAAAQGAPDLYNRNAILNGYVSESCAGTGTLSGGTLAVTLSANCSAGATPLYGCTDQTAAAACKTAVSGTTLTLTGTTTDVILYFRVQ